MTLNEAKAVLSKYQELGAKEQKRNAGKINEAFKEFLASSPTEDEFQLYLHNLVLTPRMLWCIWYSRPWKSDERQA